MIKNLEEIEDSEKFIKYANNLVEEFNKNFIKSINFCLLYTSRCV